MTGILEETGGNVVFAHVETSAGTIEILAEIALDGRHLTLGGLHVYGINVDANDLGIGGIRRIVREVMEDLNVDQITIEGAIRTTGAGPGRTPRPLRFTRKVPAEK
ncbi:MAG: hypothetical protein V7604_1873 [Hyphomicrobiales bacterium]|jgi:hypothetical protein